MIVIQFFISLFAVFFVMAGSFITFFPGKIFSMIVGINRSGPKYLRWVGVPFATSLNHFFLLIKSIVTEEPGFEDERKKPHFIICNHLSFSDIPLMMEHMGCMFIMKSELLKFTPGWVAMQFGAVPIKRVSLKAMIEAADNAIEKIEHGAKIAFFPEGTRSKTGEMLKLHSGIIKKVYNAGIPVCPCGLWNTQKVIRPGSLLIRPFQKLALHKGKLLYPHDYENFADFFKDCEDCMKQYRQKAIDSLAD